MIAWAEDFIYTHGVLCYSVTTDKIRVLDIHRSATTELVLEASFCLPLEIPDFSWTEPYRFSPIHHCDGILSCLLTQKMSYPSIHWLAIFDLEKAKLIGFQEIRDVKNLFVRNNRELLFFGTRSRLTNDEQRRWEIATFDIRKQQITGSSLALWDLEGEDLGSDICFEIFGDYFYCVSNKASVYRRVPGNSYYHVFRFPLKKPEKKSFEYPPIVSLWRRYIREGITDPRWNSIQLARDEASGKLFIYECRKESLQDYAQSRRACYKRELQFVSTPTVQPSSVPSNTGDGYSGNENVENFVEGGVEGEDKIDLGTYYEPRCPENVHIGDSGTLGTAFAINECFVRSYIPSCETFVDIISTPPFPMPETQQLRLRTRPKLDFDGGSTNTSRVEKDQSITNKPKETSEATTLGLRSDIEYWPRESSPAVPNPSCNILRDILAPVSLVNEVDWAMDDRSLVYAAAEKGQFRPIILVSFDPGIRLPGFKNSISRDLDISRPRCWPVEGFPPTKDNEELSAELQSAHSRASKNADMSSTSQSVEDCTSNTPSGSGDSRTKPTPSTSEANSKSWANPVEAFYLMVPKLFASYPYGADLTR